MNPRGRVGGRGKGGRGRGVDMPEPTSRSPWLRRVTSRECKRKRNPTQTLLALWKSPALYRYFYVVSMLCFDRRDGAGALVIWEVWDRGFRLGTRAGVGPPPGRFGGGLARCGGCGWVFGCSGEDFAVVVSKVVDSCGRGAGGLGGDMKRRNVDLT